MARAVALVAMGKSSRHRTSFNENAKWHGFVSDHNTIDCNDIVKPLTYGSDHRIDDRDAHGGHPDIIARIIARDGFINLCDTIVQRFLLPQEPLPVIVLQDDFGKEASWVAASFMKDVLNSIIDDGGNKRFNVQSYVLYQNCEMSSSRNMNMGSEVFQAAVDWLNAPWTEEEPPEYRNQYGVAELYDYDNGVYVRAKSKMAEVRELVHQYFPRRLPMHQRKAMQAAFPDEWEPEESQPTTRTVVAPSTPPGGPAHRSSKSAQSSQLDGPAHRSSESAQSSQLDGPADRSSESAQASQLVPITEEHEDSSPDERANFRAPGVVDTGADAASAWYGYNQRHRDVRPPWHAPTPDHRRGDTDKGKGNTDHRKGATGKGKGKDKGKSGKGKSGDRYVADDTNSDSHNAGVAVKRKQLVQRLQVDDSWKTFDQGIHVWFPMLDTLGVDDVALNRLRDLASITVDDDPQNPPRPVGYFAANAIIHKVFSKYGQKQRWKHENPSAFIMGCCNNTEYKAGPQAKRKDPPQSSGNAQNRPSKGSKSR